MCVRKCVGVTINVCLHECVCVHARARVCVVRCVRVYVICVYGVLPMGLLTFLGFLGNAEFSPWKRLPE